MVETELNDDKQDQPVMSKYFKKLSGFQRGPTGLEWWLFKRLPKMFLVGCIVLLLAGLYFYQDAAPSNAAQQKVIYSFLGLFFSYFFFSGAAFIGCIVVIIMKGPAYVADGYKLPKEDPSKEKPPLE